MGLVMDKKLKSTCQTLTKEELDDIDGRLVCSPRKPLAKLVQLVDILSPHKDPPQNYWNIGLSST
jgi:hypothetical protein